MRQTATTAKQTRAAGQAGDPETWARTNATIVHPRLGRIPFAPYAYQAEFLRQAYAPRRIVLKARQVGFSQVFALEALFKAITHPESTILLVSRSQDLAVNLLRYCYLTYGNLRDAPDLTKSNESEIGFTNGSRIKSIPANRSTGRGFTATDVYLDEFAYAEYDREIYQSVGPAVSQGGRIVIGSTPNGVGNLFHELYISGDGFTRQAVPWWECPNYYTPDEQAAGLSREQCDWFRRERPKYTAHQWAAEYECDFVGSGDAVFKSADIDGARAGALGPTPAQPGHFYLTSVDIGRRQDATVVNTFDLSVTPVQRVKHERYERLPYPMIQRTIEQRAAEYPGEVWIESNGVGDPVIENLNIVCRPFVTTTRSKVQAIQALALLLEHGQLKADWTAQEHKELTLYRWDDKDLTQDCVMSLAIGAYQIAEAAEPVAAAVLAQAQPVAPSRFAAGGLDGGRWGRGNGENGWRRR